MEEKIKRGSYNKMFKGYPDVLNIMQMCEMLGGISKQTGYKFLKEGKIKSVKVGREYRIVKKYVIDFLLQNNWFFLTRTSADDRIILSMVGV